MNALIKSKHTKMSVMVFAGMPLLIWALGDFPGRSLLKESISVMTILVFCQMIGLFFWSRSNSVAVKDLKMRRTIKIHRIIGYTCVSIMLLHPLFLVVPRFYESGVSPSEAFITILTTFNQGVVLGMLAWSLLLTIGITALVRNRLPINYKTWRTVHGILAVVFVTVATWHAVDLGRHSSLTMSILIILLTAGGVRLFLKNGLFKKSQQSRSDR